MTDKKRKKQVFFMVLIGLSIAFIWLNSFKKSTFTMNDSDSVKGFLIAIFEFVGIDISSSFFIEYIRKFGHFAEFFVLGGELMLYNALYLKAKLQSTLNVLYLGVVCAFCDETIQLIPWLGRSSEIRDVWIDILGVICGMAVIFIGYKLITLHRHRKI